MTLIAAAAGSLLVLIGCVSVRVPERVEIHAGKPPPVDSSRVPATATHEECRTELDLAYQNLQYLEREAERWQRKAEEYQRERDEARRKLKRYED